MQRSQLLRSRHESASPRRPCVLAVDEALHPLLGHPDAPVGWVDDQRVALDLPRLLQPARAGAPSGVDDRLLRLPPQGLLLARQPFEQRGGRVVPHPLEIRIPPGSARQLGLVRREAIRRPLGKRGSNRGSSGQQEDHEPGRAEHATESVHAFSSKDLSTSGPRAALKCVARSRVAPRPRGARIARRDERACRCRWRHFHRTMIVAWDRTLLSRLPSEP